MCGIAGIMRRDGQAPPAETLDKLTRALTHRGPDGTGRYLAGDTGMIQTRLAIIDLETGTQPLYGPHGAALVANGEIYNYQGLRQTFGYARFRTRSDCEPPLMLYADMAEEGLDQLRGMYALALHDAPRGRLLLARDPFGIKPLYYAERTDGIAFASEPQALIAAGLASRELATDKVTELAYLKFATGAETVFRDIRRVLPGETLVVEGGRIVARRRRAALPEGGPVECGEAEALNMVEAALTDSVRAHLQSDVGYGMFLSGGIDSSVLLALVARETGQSVHTWTTGFPGAGVQDERSAAADIARRFGATHREVAFTPEDFWELLPRVAAAMDDPVADYATLPTFKMAQLAASEQKVVLTGEGGDELLAGYPHYRSVARPWWRWRRRPAYRIARMMRSMKEGRMGGLLAGDSVVRKYIAATEAIVRTPGRSRLQAAQAVDCADWLPHDLLLKVDRCLMAHGLEGRTPFLDPVVAQAVFRLPDKFKVNGRVLKWLLRTLLERLAPGVDAFGPKLGFDVPAAEWARARRGLGRMVAAQPGVRELCRPEVVHDVFESGRREGEQAVKLLLFYALWHHIHALGHEPGPSPEETLAQG